MNLSFDVSTLTLSRPEELFSVFQEGTLAMPGSSPILRTTSTEAHSEDTTRMAIIRKFQEANLLHLLTPINERFKILRSRRKNWDGKGSEKPNKLALNHAFVELQNFLDAVIENGQVWKTPFISSDEDGYITIEWICGRHELHLEVSEKGVEFVKVWGINIVNEMYQNYLKPSEYAELWDWLTDD